jgi:quercetin dioxygenase-like cupin family protein
MIATQTRIVATSGIDPVRWHVQEGRVLLRSEHTGGAFSMIEFTTPPGGGPRPHTHEREAETFYVLEGEYDILVGAKTVRALPGSLVYSPKSVKHRFTNVGSSTARMLCVFTPGGAETMFEDMAALLSGPGPVDPAAMAALNLSHGVRSYPE